MKWPADIALVESHYQQLMKEHFGVKAPEWSYEEEVRYVVDLGRCMPRTRMYFFEFTAAPSAKSSLGLDLPLACVPPTPFLASHYKEIGVSLYTAYMHPEKYEIVGPLSRRASSLIR